MGTVHPFRLKHHALCMAASADVRAVIEDAAQSALDTADSLIALLDRMDGNPDDEDGGDVEPSLGAPEGHASQIVWLRGSDLDHEEEAATSD
jgi:hypothetical protein